MQKNYETVYKKQQECTEEYPNYWLQDLCAMIKQLGDNVVIESDGVESYKQKQEYIKFFKTTLGFEINPPVHSKITAKFENRVHKNNGNYTFVGSDHEYEGLYTIIFETEGKKQPLTLFIDNNGMDANCTYAFYSGDVKMHPQTFVIKYGRFLHELEKSFKKELEKRNQQVASPLQNTTDQLLDTIS